MNGIVLWFASPVVRFGVLGGATIETAELDGWRFREAYEPAEEPGVPADVGKYRLTIQRTVTVKDNVHELYAKGVDLVERVNRLWTVAAGVPFGLSGFSVLLSSLETPTGWETNLDEVDDAIQQAAGGLTGKVDIYGVEWFHTSTLPLKRLITALKAYETLDDIMKELIDLHYEARRAPSRRGSFRLAKALEIVRELLPGEDDKARERSLPPDVRSALTHPLSWLYEVSNKRRETRHPITKTGGLALHPELKPEEYQEFLRDADLVIRYAIGDALGLDVIRVADSDALVLDESQLPPQP